MRVIVATTNEGKLAEFRYLFKGYEVVSMSDIGYHGDIKENGCTYLQNAYKKAKNIVDNVELTDRDIVIADDTGLEVEKLHGELGLYSARYMGYSTPYSEKNQSILKALEGVGLKERKARYVCGICVYMHGCYLEFEGVLEGYIGGKPLEGRKEAFDPIFYLDNDKSLDIISMEEKMSISHRAKAVDKVINVMNRML